MNPSLLDPEIGCDSGEPVKKLSITPPRVVVQASDSGGNASASTSALDSSQRKKTMSGTDDVEEEARAAEVRMILDQLVAAGSTLSHEVKKVAELSTQSGQVVYLIKTHSTINRIILAVHPEHMPEQLACLPGVDSVSSKHRFHSNMSQFPKKRNRGKTETRYGWQVITSSLGDCQRFLASF